jgi:hypothetical protein
MLLKYWTKNKNHSFISLDGEVWGFLPTRTLHHLYPFVSEIQISETQRNELIALLEKRAWWMLQIIWRKANIANTIAVTT